MASASGEGVGVGDRIARRGGGSTREERNAISLSNKALPRNMNEFKLLKESPKRIDDLKDKERFRLNPAVGLRHERIQGDGFVQHRPRKG